jgi:hypothetical protein
MIVTKSKLNIKLTYISYDYTVYRSIEPKRPLTIVEEKQRVFFLKTHKCAGTTIQNILMRYGHKENLDFLLPNKNNYVGNPEHFNISMVINVTADNKFDLFVHHTRYSQDVKSVMRSGTFFVTILREPTSLFQSMYSFYHFEKKYKNNLTKFISNLSNNSSFRKNVQRYSKKLGINQMSWDLGMAPEDFESTKMINKFIDIIENDFDFIMIFEYLDASLVLFANLMQWPLERVAYLPLNTSNDTHKPIITNYDVMQLEKVNMADNMLYKWFLEKFKEKIYKYGIKKLKIGIGKLMAINQEIREKCVKSITNKGYAKTFSYELKENTNICQYITMNELKYTSYLRNTQYERHRKYKALDKLMNNN